MAASRFSCTGSQTQQGSTITCTAGVDCIINCSIEQCYQDATIDARQASNLIIESIDEKECFKRATIKLPDDGNANLTQSGSATKSYRFDDATGGIFAGTHTQSIILDCTDDIENDGKSAYDDCKELQLNASSAQYLEINIAEAGGTKGSADHPSNIICPKASSLSPSCVINLSGTVNIDFTHFYADNGMPQDLLINGWNTADFDGRTGAAVYCNSGIQSLENGDPQDGSCWMTKAPTNRPTTANPTTSAPSQFPISILSQSPSVTPSSNPIQSPSSSPTESPSHQPSETSDTENPTTTAPSQFLSSIPSQSDLVSLTTQFLYSTNPTITDPSQRPTTPSQSYSDSPSTKTSKSPSAVPLSLDVTVFGPAFPTKSPLMSTLQPTSYSPTVGLNVDIITTVDQVSAIEIPSSVVYTIVAIGIFLALCCVSCMGYWKRRQSKKDEISISASTVTDIDNGSVASIPLSAIGQRASSHFSSSISMSNISNSDEDVIGSLRVQISLHSDGKTNSIRTNITTPKGSEGSLKSPKQPFLNRIRTNQNGEGKEDPIAEQNEDNEENNHDIVNDGVEEDTDKKMIAIIEKHLIPNDNPKLQQVNSDSAHENQNEIQNVKDQNQRKKGLGAMHLKVDNKLPHKVSDVSDIFGEYKEDENENENEDDSIQELPSYLNTPTPSTGKVSGVTLGATTPQKVLDESEASSDDDIYAKNADIANLVMDVEENDHNTEEEDNADEIGDSIVDDMVMISAISSATIHLPKVRTKRGWL